MQRFRNDRPANHGDSIVTPTGQAGTLQLLQMQMTGEATPKIAMVDQRGMFGGNSVSEPIQVSECYHAEDAFKAVGMVATLQNENTTLVANAKSQTETLQAAQVEIAKLTQAVKDLTPK